ncbi:endocuticle structural glycoprotein SgAbd-2-like [Trichogramma pretiosum]|uniref:endocuticle structural glycoprotein SgAbd-2-like n=1 Tax=Trichogramma pretiosum TaxID=7493 RepID=UPI000C71B16D|nr:endocuticle structural glycoprotein SgAbd-2-like [Trichogramma pretiosum]
MKYIIAIVALAAVACAQQQPPVAILRQTNDIYPDGSYAYSYETENGIAHQEQGVANIPGETGYVPAVQGSYGYTAPDGTPIVITYVADQNGFQPQGEHLPKPHPIPEAIARSIEYNLANARAQLRRK